MYLLLFFGMIMLCIFFVIIGTLFISSYNYGGWGILCYALALFIFFFSWLPSVLIWDFYERPLIEVEVNKQCKQLGYDTFEKWNGIGFFPDKAIWIRCKFVDNRRDIQGELNLGGIIG